MSFLAPIAGAVVGGLLSDSGGGSQQTASKEPWGPAAPWIKDNIKTGQALQGYYQQNPFNSLQQTAYQNYFADQDNYRQAIAPQMNALAQRLMGSNYSRQGGMGGGVGSVPLPQRAAPAGQGGGLLAPAMPNAAPNSRAYGLLDFTQLNPFTNNGIKPIEQSPTYEDEMTEAERLRKIWEEEEAMRRSA